MSSSVSSERAFSSAGITITKRRNRLKGDVVEGLQILKSAIRNGKSLFKGDESEFDQGFSSDEDNEEDEVGDDPEGLQLLIPLEDDL